MLNRRKIDDDYTFLTSNRCLPSLPSALALPLATVVVGASSTSISAISTYLGGRYGE